jgi:phosphoenolpyruvate synthase/pyruvate phosphate dikinase
VIGATRFADRDPSSRDELTQVVAACRRFGCRIGIRGLQESRYPEFSAFLHKLGADSLSLTPERSASTTLAMLVIAPSHVADRR